MPNTTNAKKALKQSHVRKARNRSQRSALRTVIKRFRDLAASGDKEKSEAAFRIVMKRLDQAAAKNLIHANKAARDKSRLSKLVPR